MEEIYISLLKRYNDIETYSAWEKGYDRSKQDHSDQ